MHWLANRGVPARVDNTLVRFKDNVLTKENAWTLFALAAAVAGAAAAQHLLEFGWPQGHRQPAADFAGRKRRDVA